MTACRVKRGVLTANDFWLEAHFAKAMSFFQHDSRSPLAMPLHVHEGSREDG